MSAGGPAVTYLSTTGSLGGAELDLVDIVAALGAAHPGWRPRAVLGADGPLRGALEAHGAAVVVVPMPTRLARLGDSGARGAGLLRLAARAPAAAAATAGYLRRLGRALAEGGPEWVQTNDMKAHVLGARAAPRGAAVAWYLQDFVGSRPVMSRLLRLAATPRVAAAAISRSVADDATTVIGRPVRAIYAAIDTDRFAPGPGDGPALDAAAGRPPPPPGTVRVGLVATFARWKGHEVFLEAVARTDPAAAVRYYVVGGPIYRSTGSQYALDELRAAAARLGVADRVAFTGHRDDPAAAIRALDVVVHASTKPEPFGRVIVEGMACGRAVVAARAGGAAELIGDGRAAIGCPPGDPSALAEALGRLVGDADLRRRLGEAGRRLAVDRYDRGRLPAEWSDLYDRGRPAGAAPRPAAAAADR